MPMACVINWSALKYMTKTARDRERLEPCEARIDEWFLADHRNAVGT